MSIRIVLPGLLTLVLAPQSVLPAAEDVQQGETVYATQQAPLKIEDRVVASADSDDPLVVRDVEGKWLWVETATGDRGWIDRQFITLEDPNAVSAPAPGPLDAAPTAVPANTAALTDDDLLVAIGALSGQNVYVTYAYIGAVADAYASDVFTADQVQELMQEVIALCDAARGSLQSLSVAGLSPDDRQSLAGIARILNMLSAEAQALAAFARSQSPEDLAEYETARAAVWPEIQGLLGIQ